MVPKSCSRENFDKQPEFVLFVLLPGGKSIYVLHGFSFSLHRDRTFVRFSIALTTIRLVQLHRRTIGPRSVLPYLFFPQGKLLSLN